MQGRPGLETPEPAHAASPTTPPPWHGRKRLVALAVALGLVAAIATAGYVWWRVRGPTRPSIGQAVHRFRASSGHQTRTARLQPPPGVYSYTGQGDERLSFLSTQQSQAGTLPGTVTRTANGCWSFSVQYNSFHRQAWRRCTVDGRLVELGNTTDQKFDFGPLSQTEHTEVVCTPPITLYDPATAPGHHEPIRCRGHSQTTKANATQLGRVTYIGPGTVTVAGTKVPTLHYSEDTKLSGGQHGTAHEEVWLAAEDGLPLREQRTIRVVSPAPAPLNEVTYTEQGTWRLSSLTPRT